MSSISRREFVEAALAACACALCPLIAEAQAPAGQQAPPQGGVRPGGPGAGPGAGPGGWRGPGGGGPAPMPTTPVDIGAPAQYAAGGIFDKFIPNGVIIVSDKTKVYAMTASCTHQRGKLAKDAASNQIKCTKHNGVFTAAGTPVSGPPKVALARFGITKNAAGNLVVDPSKRFEQADWEKEGAFFKLA